MLLLLTAVPASGQGDQDSIVAANRQFRHQTALHSLSRTERADVVMLGNSITFGADWSDLLGRPGVVNRGIPSDITAGFLKRLPAVLRLHPRLCCIMGGINDLYAGISVGAVLRNYRAILDTLRAHGIRPVIQSTLLVSRRWKDAERKNREVMELNRGLADLARREGIDLLDVNALVSKDSFLREEYTTDGVHLTPAAYAVWRDALDSLLTRSGL